MQEYHRRSFSTRKPAHRCSAVIQVSYSASYNVGRRPLVGPLRKAAWSSGSSWPNRPGDHSTRKRTWWGRPLGDFQGRINPRLIQTDALPACRLRFAREAHTCQVGKPCPVGSGLSHSTHCVREVLEVLSLRNTRLKSRQITPFVISQLLTITIVAGEVTCSRSASVAAAGAIPGGVAAGVVVRPRRQRWSDPGL